MQLPVYIRLPLILFVVYCVFLIFIYLSQERMIFFPVQEDHSGRALPSHVTRYAVLVDGNRVEGWLINPQYASERLLLYYGGNAEDLFYSIGGFSHLPVATLLVPYPGYNGNGGEPSQDSIFQQSVAVYTGATEQFAPRRTFLMGRSLGSAVASFMATQTEIAGLILITPFDSIEQIAKKQFPFLPVSLLLKHPFNSSDYVRSLRCPVLVIYGSEDQVIGPERSEALIRALPGTPKVLFLDGAGHNDIESFPKYWQAIMGFLSDS